MRVKVVRRALLPRVSGTYSGAVHAAGGGGLVRGSAGKCLTPGSGYPMPTAAVHRSNQRFEMVVCRHTPCSIVTGRCVCGGRTNVLPVAAGRAPS